MQRPAHGKVAGDAGMVRAARIRQRQAEAAEQLDEGGALRGVVVVEQQGQRGEPRRRRNGDRGTSMGFVIEHPS
ncbi:hypothetical protein D3C78_1648840 [compost metagenome]